MLSLTDTDLKRSELEREIAKLPAGSITRKNVNGHEYFYRRWTDNGKRIEKYIPAEEVEEVRKAIEKRRLLEKELKALSRRLPKTEKTFDCIVRVGRELLPMADSVRHFRKRSCFTIMQQFLDSRSYDKVLILYGLRRTGKTTMIRQAFCTMDEDELLRTAFIQITPMDSMASLNRDLRQLELMGYRNVFIDEVTHLEDFIDGSALFSDVFAACGMKIVLSGTDSLGFLFAEDEQLYDRCILIHTTFIPYREFEQVLGIRGIDEYIRYGGTMCLSGTRYNETSTFVSKGSTDEYIDTSIARNIQHSLRCYQHGGHFRHLQDLYENNELTSAVNRIVENINHRFALEVLVNDFKSHDLGLSAANLRRDRFAPTDVLDRVNLKEVTGQLMKRLEIRNRTEQSVNIDDVHVKEIREYLDLLDLTKEIEMRHLPDTGNVSYRSVITQPGLRYAQAKALIESLMLDPVFSSLSLSERNSVQERILNEIRGRMMEDIVLLETSIAKPDKQVFILQFPVGEYDMVVFDPHSESCELYEIKHSSLAMPEQTRHFRDREKCQQTEHRYGQIRRKCVLYRGKNMEQDGIQYMNVEEYLRNISS